MTVILTTRRRFLFGLGAATGALIAAPSIVRAASLMPIKVQVTAAARPPLTDREIWDWFRHVAAAAQRRGQYGEMAPVRAHFGDREAVFTPLGEGALSIRDALAIRDGTERPWRKA